MGHSQLCMPTRIIYQVGAMELLLWSESGISVTRVGTCHFLERNAKVNARAKILARLPRNSLVPNQTTMRNILQVIVIYFDVHMPTEYRSQDEPHSATPVFPSSRGASTSRASEVLLIQKNDLARTRDSASRTHCYTRFAGSIINDMSIHHMLLVSNQGPSPDLERSNLRHEAVCRRRWQSRHISWHHVLDMPWQALERISGLRNHIHAPDTHHLTFSVFHGTSAMTCPYTHFAISQAAMERRAVE